MNGPSNTDPTPCGDTCGLVDAFVSYIPKEDRMKRAIEAVEMGKLSQRAAARKFGVAQSGISQKVKRARVINLDHPPETQSGTEPAHVDALAPMSEPTPTKAQRDGKIPTQYRQRALRDLCRRHGIAEANGKPLSRANTSDLYDALIAAGHKIPAPLLSRRCAYRGSEEATDPTDDLAEILPAAPVTVMGPFPFFRAQRADEPPYGYRRAALRALALHHGIAEAGGRATAGAKGSDLCDALTAAGHEIPSGLLPRNRRPKGSADNTQHEAAATPAPAPSVPSTRTLATQPNDQAEAFSAALEAAAVNDGAWGDPDDDHPIYAERLDVDAVRDRVLADVLASDRPADFKRALKLLAELDEICTEAWHGRHPEPWNHHDWAHINSEVKIIFSFTNQRSEETADDYCNERLARDGLAAAV